MRGQGWSVGRSVGGSVDDGGGSGRQRSADGTGWSVVGRTWTDGQAGLGRAKGRTRTVWFGCTDFSELVLHVFEMAWLSWLKMDTG